MTQRLHSIVDVHVILRRDGRVLMGRRASRASPFAADTLGEDAIDMVVKKATVEWLSPARRGEVLDLPAQRSYLPARKPENRRPMPLDAG